MAAINTNALVPKSESASEITVASWNPIFLSSSRLLELPKGKKLPYWTQRQDKSRRCNCRSKCTRSRLLPRRLPFHSPRNLCEESEGRLFVLRRVSTCVSQTPQPPLVAPLSFALHPFFSLCCLSGKENKVGCLLFNWSQPIGFFEPRLMSDRLIVP